MKIITLITSNWDSEEQFDQRCSGEHGWDGLHHWSDVCDKWVNPDYKIIACGTPSDPDLIYRAGGLENCIVLNAGTPKTKPYCCIWWHYSLCAHMAGFYYALNDPDWDLLVQIDNDMLIGDVNFDTLLCEFMVRPEEVLSSAWCGCWPGGPFWAWKRAGVTRFVDNRMRANLIDETEWRHHNPHKDRPILHEEEVGLIMKGRWWNPWPQFESMRQDYGQEAEAHTLNEEVMKWPFVRLPHPDVVGRYMMINGEKTKPLLPG